jgi:hypothetical protein
MVQRCPTFSSAGVASTIDSTKSCCYRDLKGEGEGDLREGSSTTDIMCHQLSEDGSRHLKRKLASTAEMTSMVLPSCQTYSVHSMKRDAGGRISKEG